METEVTYCRASYSLPTIQRHPEQPNNRLNKPPSRGLDQTNCTHVITLSTERNAERTQMILKYEVLYSYRRPANASNDHFIVMSSQMLLHVSAYQRHHQGAHMILTSYLYIGVHYKKNNGVSNNTASVSIVTLWK
jgi:hypothetical protein